MLGLFLTLTTTNCKWALAELYREAFKGNHCSDEAIKQALKFDAYQLGLIDLNNNITSLGKQVGASTFIGGWTLIGGCTGYGIYKIKQRFTPSTSHHSKAPYIIGGAVVCGGAAALLATIALNTLPTK